ncbi:hypothetical protein [Halioxenophilus sp. WMMB6]|uniref:hypothetical protein n=1 Tax=Halioxenophilus sp. WMMB6 TaxID=3073815 RepID=UPI00295ED4EC|nr:hypothetical protein [Halioxenophilus sp. WMMB6]
MEFAKLFLEYLKVLVWPAILGLVIILYGTQVFEILKTRDVSAFGLEVSGSLDNLAQNYEQQISELKQQISSMDTTEGKQDLLSRLDQINGNVKQELDNVRSQIQAPDDTLAASKREQAVVAERRGFEAIIKGDVTAALAEFDKAQTFWPSYHNVSEIHTLLVRHRDQLNSPEQWAKLCQQILAAHSWGMPSDIRRAIAEKAQLADQ